MAMAHGSLNYSCSTNVLTFNISVEFKDLSGWLSSADKASNYSAGLFLSSHISSLFQFTLSSINKCFITYL